MSQRGRFITIEGVEGVGKSTSIEHVQSILARHHIASVSTREPGGTPLSERIRALLLDKANMSMDAMTELLLMFAARVQHVEELIKPALSEGRWVICDRFTDSTYAYQGGGRGIDADLIGRLETLSLGDFRPDLTLILDLPVAQGMARAAGRSERDRFESEDMAFFNRVREAFLSRAEGEARYRVVDASGDIEMVQSRLTPIIEAEIAATEGVP